MATALAWAALPTTYVVSEWSAAAGDAPRRGPQAAAEGALAFVLERGLGRLGARVLVVRVGALGRAGAEVEPPACVEESPLTSRDFGPFSAVFAQNCTRSRLF